ALRPHVASGENHVEGCLQSHPAPQALRAAHARNDPKLHFGQREDGLRVIGAHAIAACERDLESATETRAVDRGDKWCPQPLEAVQQILAETAYALRVGRHSELRELFDVRAGDETVGLSRNQ